MQYKRAARLPERPLVSKAISGTVRPRLVLDQLHKAGDAHLDERFQLLGIN
jgi:hypothetical protein